jgi:hypothetical protein
MGRDVFIEFPIVLASCFDSAQHERLFTESSNSERNRMFRASLFRQEAGYKPLRRIIKSNGRSGLIKSKKLKESGLGIATKLLNSLHGTSASNSESAYMLSTGF